MKLLSKSAAVFDCLNRVLAFIAAAIILFIMLSIGSDVIMRYFFKHPQIWVLEITEYALLYMTFLAGTWLLKSEGHVRMDLILFLMKPRTRIKVNILTSSLLVVLFVILTWYGAKVTWEQFQYGYFTSTPLRAPTGPIMAVIPLGCFLLIIQSLRMLFGYIGALKENRAEEK